MPVPLKPLSRAYPATLTVGAQQPPITMAQANPNVWRSIRSVADTAKRQRRSSAVPAAMITSRFPTHHPHNHVQAHRLHVLRASPGCRLSRRKPSLVRPSLLLVRKRPTRPGVAHASWDAHSKVPRTLVQATLRYTVTRHTASGPRAAVPCRVVRGQVSSAPPRVAP